MPIRNYYRVMLGARSAYAGECFADGFFGADFGIDEDLTGLLPDQWRSFNAQFVPVFLKKNPAKSKIAAGLACGMLWTIAKGIRPGDVVLSPDGAGAYRVGLVEVEYRYAPGQILPHRRQVQWLSLSIQREAMSEALRRSSGSIGTVSTITDHNAEIDQFMAGAMPGAAPTVIASDPVVEDPVAFAMEKHLEDFLVKSWAQTALAQQYKIFEEDGELVGQQYATDAGPIDILAVSKDGLRLLVVELKRGRASDVVVGQILRYMGYVTEQVADPGQVVEGAIIALDDDQRLRWALVAVPSIKFYRYQVSFKLVAQ
jgi:restriction system protein